MSKKIKTTNKIDFSLIKKDSPDYVRRYYDANQYLRVDEDFKKIRATFIKWVKDNKPHINLAKVKEMPDWRMEVVARLIYMKVHGADVPDSTTQHVDNLLETEEFISLVHPPEDGNLEIIELDLEDQSVSISDKKTIQEIVKEKAGFVISEIDSLVDDLITGRMTNLKDVNVTHLLRKFGVKQAHAKYINTAFNNTYEELCHVINKTDPDLVEGYKSIPSSRIKLVKTLIEEVRQSLTIISTALKAVKKPRKKKAVNKNKLVEKVLFLKESTEYGVASINPLDILGAQELWVFNTKTRKLGKYVAFDQAGLSVKGTTLLNFSKDSSVAKTLRKPKEQIKLLKGTQKGYANAFKEIKSAETSLNGRLNDQTILLKVFR